MDTIIFSLPSSEKFSNALFVHSIKNGALGLEEGRVVGSPWVAESTGRQIERQDEYWVVGPPWVAESTGRQTERQNEYWVVGPPWVAESTGRQTERQNEYWVVGPQSPRGGKLNDRMNI